MLFGSIEFLNHFAQITSGSKPISADRLGGLMLVNLRVQKILGIVVFAVGLTLVSNTYSQIKVGVTFSATGPSASLGIPEKNAFAVMPTEIAGQKVEYIILDDATDPVAAVKNTRKLLTEDKVDIILGSTISPNSLAMVDVVSEAQTPMIAMASSLKIIDPIDAKKFWVFKVPQNDSHMMTALSAHMSDVGVKTVGIIGFNDAYGEGVISEFTKLTPVRRLNIVSSERYARTDTSVTGQILKQSRCCADCCVWYSRRVTP